MTDRNKHYFSKKDLKNIVYYNPDVCFTIDLTTKVILDANLLFEDFFQEKNQMTIGQTIDDLKCWEKPSDWNNFVLLLQSKGYCTCFETIFKNKNGRLLPITISGRLFKDNENSFALVSLRDISCQKDLERDLRSQYGILSAVIENAAEGICMCHGMRNFPFIQFTIWNQSMVNITGYTMDQVNRLGWEKAFGLSGQEKKRLMERMALMTMGQNLNAEEWEIKASDGSPKILRISTSIVEEKDGEKQYLAIMQDATIFKKLTNELTKTQKHYKVLFENSPAIMLIIDPENGRIVDANPAACKFYGYCKARLTSMLVTDINTLSPQEIQEEMSRAKSETQNHFSFKHRLATGEVRQVEVYCGPISVQSRVLLYSIIHDATKRIQAEQNRIEKERLEAAIKTAGAVCHELNQPLQVVLSHAELLILKSMNDPQALANYQVFFREAKKMRDITVRLQNITEFKTKKYFDSIEVLDLGCPSK